MVWQAGVHVCIVLVKGSSRKLQISVAGVPYVAAGRLLVNFIQVAANAVDASGCARCCVAGTCATASGYYYPRVPRPVCKGRDAHAIISVNNINVMLMVIIRSFG